MGKFVDKYANLWINNMLLGEYRHNLDSKNRLTIPAKLRMELGEKPILTRGLDNCLFIYPRRDWELFVEKLSQLPLSQKTARNFSRFMLSGASEAEIDEMGRILVPDFLRKYGRFEKTIVVVGVQNRVEIWAEKEWGKYMTEIEKSSGDIAENLSGFGI